MAKKKTTKRVAAKTVVKKRITANSLRDLLWENINDLKSGSLQAKEANAMTGTARAMLQDQKQKIELIKLAGIKDKAILKQIGML